MQSPPPRKSLRLSFSFAFFSPRIWAALEHTKAEVFTGGRKSIRTEISTVFYCHSLLPKKSNKIPCLRQQRAFSCAGFCSLGRAWLCGSSAPYDVSRTHTVSFIQELKSATMINMAPFMWLGLPLWWLKSWGWLVSPSSRMAGLLKWWHRGPRKQKPKLSGLYMTKPRTGTASLHSIGHFKSQGQLRSKGRGS